MDEDRAIQLGERVGEPRPPARNPSPTLADMVGREWALVFDVALKEAAALQDGIEPTDYEKLNDAEAMAEDIVMVALEKFAEQARLRHIIEVVAFPPIYDVIDHAFDHYVPPHEGGGGGIPFLDRIFLRKDLVGCADAVLIILEVDKERPVWRDERGLEIKEYIGPGLRMIARRILEGMKLEQDSEPYIEARLLWRDLSLGEPASSALFYQAEEYEMNTMKHRRDVWMTVLRFHAAVTRNEAQRHLATPSTRGQVG